MQYEAMKVGLIVKLGEGDWTRWFEPKGELISLTPSITSIWSALEELPFPHLSYEDADAVIWQ